MANGKRAPHCRSVEKGQAAHKRFKQGGAAGSVFQHEEHKGSQEREPFAVFVLFVLKTAPAARP
jgi:hypothetical protein